MEFVGVTLLALVTIATRFLTRGRVLFNWDSIQYALGVERFDMVAHRPHPPGYLGYIALGRVFTHVSGDHPEAGLALLSAVAEAAAVVLIYLAARAAWGRFGGWAAGLLFASSPLVWLYGSVALNYALEPAFVAAVLWAGVRACAGSRRALVVAALVTALAGAIRPTDEIFLAVPLAWAAGRTWQRGDRRALALAGAALVGASLAWLVPLLVATGGLRTYLAASSELSARASSTSALWKAGLPGVARNGTAVVAGLATALGLLVPLGAAHLVFRAVPGLRAGRLAASRDYVALAVATTVPALAVYVLVHIGQLGYLLLLLPAIMLPAGLALGSLATAISRPHAPALRAGLLVLCVTANIAIFALPVGGMLDQLTQRDAYAGSMLAAVRRYDPASTLLVTSAEADGSYRLAQYYLPQYRVVALGRDRRLHAGEMFAVGGAPGWRGTVPEYDLARFEHAGNLTVPAATRTVLILDAGAINLVGDRSMATLVPFGDSWDLWSVRLDRGPDATVAGRYVYLDAADCPCRGATAARPLPIPHQPL